MTDIETALSGLGPRIAKRRKALKLTLQDVADRAGFTKSHVWELEQGRSLNPSVRMCWNLSLALEMTLSDLIGVWSHADLLSPTAMQIGFRVDEAIRNATVNPTLGAVS